MDYDVQRCTRHCCRTGRQLEPGETYFSVLTAEGAELQRRDYSVEAWTRPPEEALGWWKSRLATPEARRRQWAPNDVMLQVFEELAAEPTRQDMRYVLGLLLVRRRVFRLEETEQDPQGREVLVAYCPRNETTYKVPAAVPDEARIEEIQEELARLLQ